MWPSPSECRALQRAAAPLLAAASGEALALEDLHLTLAFLGAVPEEAVPPLLKLAARIRARSESFALDVLEYWPRAGILCAVATQTPPALSDLAQQLRAELATAGVPADDKPLRAHVTLARRVQLERARLSAFPSLALKIRSREFSLAQSGPRADARLYTRLGTWRLI